MLHSLLLNAALLAAAPLAASAAAVDTPLSVTVPVATSMFSESAFASLAPAPATAASAAAPAASGNATGPSCGKGYTYCGYMLTSNGHNFDSSAISKSYCSDLSKMCTNGKPKTDPSQAVYVCLNDQPSSIQLMCACSGKCVNDASTNHIAHCDTPCVNS
ncbi:hypothetical protein GGR56DRAFT_75919 [Xylariaceae sp. FL0804]|nr:hypothetical protein GGR56DRAFT_75919 [Xylariaceae sp. FL0804]